MSRTKKPSNERKRPSPQIDRPKPESSPNKQSPPNGGMFSPDSIRETVESIVIAFILAFLFRTFEAEAFVIPTGSMAPTLLGRHKDMECPECGFFYEASASQEVDAVTNKLTGDATVGGTCPMCRFPMEIGPDNPQGRSYKSYSGDRILVEKFPYQFRDPERFEVSVFKFPGGAKTNYIKRICGLPNETIRIEHGDLFVKHKSETSFAIARKEDPKKLLAVLQPVYDTNYLSPALFQSGWPQRWINAVGTPGAWTTTDQKTYQIDGKSAGQAWLRYQHVVPSHDDWDSLRQGAAPAAFPPPQLISDFTAYNTKRSVNAQFAFQPSGRGVHWVGDLATQFDLKIESEAGELVFELVEGGRQFQCAIDVATGVASLSISGDSSLAAPTAETKLQGPGRYQVRFANVDDQLRLWIDGREIQFDSPTTYQPLGNFVPTEADLLPAGIASRGVQMEIRRIRLSRDLYYIAFSSDVDAYAQPMADYDLIRTFGRLPTARDLDLFLSNSELWSVFNDFRSVEFELDEGEFLALGDNSGESKDSRLWAVEDQVGHEVPRDLLIGKALFVYWPHSEDRIPGTQIPFPFFPNFKRMKVIR